MQLFILFQLSSEHLQRFVFRVANFRHFVEKKRGVHQHQQRIFRKQILNSSNFQKNEKFARFLDSSMYQQYGRITRKIILLSDLLCNHI